MSARSKAMCSGKRRPYPEVDTHGGDKTTRQKSSVFETDKQTGLADATVANQHHLQQRARQWLASSVLWR